MEATHTPGPWQATLAYGYRIESAEGKIVATLPTHCPLTGEDPANAYLIAAAPDLLLACQELAAQIENDPAISDDSRRLLQDAIANATGKAATGWMPAGRSK